MKVVILCGGLGSRLAEETSLRPKPMVNIGDYPILWHIMKSYEKYGFNDFVLALGYKGDYIKDYFINYHLKSSNLSVNTATGKTVIEKNPTENWNVSLINTGSETLTGGRILRLKDLLKDTFMLTYGDGVSDVNISELLNFHKKHGKIATVTSVRPPARFGGMEIVEGVVKEFEEKPQIGEGSINGGFFVFEPEIFEYLEDDKTILEQSPLEKLAKNDQLAAFEHSGFWHCMDTIRDKESLNNLYNSDFKPWL